MNPPLTTTGETRRAARRGRDARRGGPGAVLAALVLGVVAILAVLRAATGWDAPHALGCSPEALAHGRLWLLATSGLVVQGSAPAVQIAATAVLAWVVIRRFGGGVFWAAAIAAHVGSTAITYAVVGAVALADPHAVRSVVDAPDYGISAVWAGCAGVVAAGGALGALPRRRLAMGFGSACLLMFLVLIPASGELSDVDHLLALAAGATVAAAALHDGARAHRLALWPARLPSLRRRPQPAGEPVG